MLEPANPLKKQELLHVWIVRLARSTGSAISRTHALQRPRCAVGQLTRLSAFSGVARDAVRVYFSRLAHYAMHRVLHCKTNEQLITLENEKRAKIFLLIIITTIKTTTPITATHLHYYI